MEPIDYEPAKKTSSRRVWYKAILATWGIVLASPVILFFCYWGMLTWHDIQLENRTKESKIIGLTPTQVISVLGPPESRQRDAWDPPGTEIMVYTNHGTRICRINFENGVAKSIERLSDH
jgi:hypothetical protein